MRSGHSPSGEVAVGSTVTRTVHGGALFRVPLPLVAVRVRS